MRIPHAIGTSYVRCQFYCVGVSTLFLGSSKLGSMRAGLRVKPDSNKGFYRWFLLRPFQTRRERDHGTLVWSEARKGPVLTPSPQPAAQVHGRCLTFAVRTEKLLLLLAPNPKEARIGVTCARCPVHPAHVRTTARKGAGRLAPSLEKHQSDKPRMDGPRPYPSTPRRQRSDADG
jgi:hypothetical protein